MCCCTTHLLFSFLVKEFLKLVNTWHSYWQNSWLLYAPHSPSSFFHQRCRTRQMGRTTCVWRTEIISNCCFVNRQIHLTLLPANIKLLQTSFDLLTNRLIPSPTDRLLIMYGILLRHLFLCCSSCVQWVMRFLIWLMWTSFCYWTQYCLFHQTNILKQCFEWLSLTQQRQHLAALTPRALRFYEQIFYKVV